VLLGKRIQDVAAIIPMSEFLGWRNFGRVMPIIGITARSG
jgi:hypothetical protein